MTNMNSRYHLISMLLLLALCAVGLSSCQTEEERRISILEESYAGGNPREDYDAYVKKHGENARKLHRVAAAAETMRFRVLLSNATVEEQIVPLTPEEVNAASEMPAEAEEPPVSDYLTWLSERTRLPILVSYNYYHPLEFVAADGKGLDEYETVDEFVGDAALAERYRTDSRRPLFMLPTETLKRWKSLPCFERLDKKIEEMEARDRERRGEEV